MSGIESVLPALSSERVATPESVTDSELPWLVHNRWMSIRSLELWLYVADTVGIAVITAMIAYTSHSYDSVPVSLVIGLFLFMAGWTGGADIAGLYREGMPSSLRMQLAHTLTVFAVCLSGVLSAGFAAGALDDTPRRVVFLSAGCAALWVTLTRLGRRLVWHRFIAAGYCAERALVFAETLPAARRMAFKLKKESAGLIGIVECAALPEHVGATTLDWVEANARSSAIDRVILCANPAIMPRVNAVLARLARLAINVSILPDLEGLDAPVLKVQRVGMLPTVELDFRPLTPWQMRLKRFEDIVLAGLVTLFITPVLALIAVAIKLDSPGMVLFRQPRAGFNDRVIEVWKFRTMYADARDDRAVHQTKRNDPRVTRVGRILRRTSLDELPQLFNVLAGSMSIVGPRPHALGMTAAGAALHDVIEDYSARHRLKPGITGWAQVNGCRGEVRTHDQLRRRVSLDCYYIENWSLRLDLWIIARTAVKILNDSDAY